jgi:hypothetical protein
MVHVRALRIEYPGAVGQTMNRGDRRKPIFCDDADSRCFVETVGGAEPMLAAALAGRLKGYREKARIARRLRRITRPIAGVRRRELTNERDMRICGTDLARPLLGLVARQEFGCRRVPFQ